MTHSSQNDDMRTQVRAAWESAGSEVSPALPAPSGPAPSPPAASSVPSALSAPAGHPRMPATPPIAPATPASAPDLPKTRLGPYEIQGILGRGGMGEVLLGFDPILNRRAAIKVLSRALAEDPEAVERFKREARAAAAIAHRNIAGIYFVGAGEDGLPFLAMEFVDGLSLHEIVRQRLQYPYSTYCDWMIQTCSGLEAAFKAGIIHRDLKPANLMIGRDGVLKIVDFGLAKIFRENSHKTQTGMVLGTPHYMSPEQGQGRALDHRSDMYSLGATFYQALTGRPPFEGPSMVDVMMRHVNSPLVPVYSVNPNVPLALCDVIHHTLAKNPAERPQSYEELIADLKAVKLELLAKEKGAFVGGGASGIAPSASRWGGPGGGGGGGGTGAMSNGGGGFASRPAGAGGGRGGASAGWPSAAMPSGGAAASGAKGLGQSAGAFAGAGLGAGAGADARGSVNSDPSEETGPGAFATRERDLFPNAFSAAASAGPNSPSVPSASSAAAPPPSASQATIRTMTVENPQSGAPPARGLSARQVMLIGLGAFAVLIGVLSVLAAMNRSLKETPAATPPPSGAPQSSLGAALKRLADSTAQPTPVPLPPDLAAARDTMAALTEWSRAVLTYEAERGRFPESPEQVSDAQFIDAAKLLDGWQQAFQIEPLDRQIRSAGADGATHTADDLAVEAGQVPMMPEHYAHLREEWLIQQGKAPAAASGPKK